MGSFMRYLVAVFGLMLLAALPARAESEWVCDNARDNAAHVACADRELKKHDAELNRVYQDLYLGIDFFINHLFLYVRPGLYHN